MRTPPACARRRRRTCGARHGGTRRSGTPRARTRERACRGRRVGRVGGGVGRAGTAERRGAAPRRVRAARADAAERAARGARARRSVARLTAGLEPQTHAGEARPFRPIRCFVPIIHPDARRHRPRGSTLGPPTNGSALRPYAVVSADDCEHARSGRAACVGSNATLAAAIRAKEHSRRRAGGRVLRRMQQWSSTVFEAACSSEGSVGVGGPRRRGRGDGAERREDEQDGGDGEATTAAGRTCRR